jgi:hypothetical protein
MPAPVLPGAGEFKGRNELYNEVRFFVEKK